MKLKLRLSKLIKSIAWLGIASTLIVALLSLSYRLAHFNDPPVYGVSFIKTYAEELGSDWRANYLAILEDLAFKKVRLVSYWDQHEPQQRHYDFSDLDWQMNEAANRGAKVTLAIGLRQPRWPECREPEWARMLNDQEWQKALLNYIDVVVRRYEGHPAIESWQLENEFGNIDFGVHCRNADRARLYDEYRLVKENDSVNPLIMNVSNQAGLPLRWPHADSYGFSLYQRVYEARVLKRYIDHPIPALWHSFRAGFIEFILQKPIIVHELQAEPWVTKPMSQTTIAEQEQSMNLEQLQHNFDFARRTGISERYLWGAEWWYWRKTQGDSSYWEQVRNELTRPLSKQ